MERKKLITIFLAVAFIVTQLFVPAVFADVSDVLEALKQLNNLGDNSKAKILESLWDEVVTEIGNGTPITVDEAYGKIKAEHDKYGLNIISDSPGEGDGQISEQAVKLLIEKLINNKQIIADHYNTYKQYVSKPLVKQVLGLSSDATEGQVYTELMKYSVPILALNDKGEFVVNGDVSAAIARKLGMNKSLIDGILGNLNNEIQVLADNINKRIGQYGSTTQDVIEALMIFGLYEDDPTAPVVVSTSPSNGENGVSTTVTIRIKYNKDVFLNESANSPISNLSLRKGSTELAYSAWTSGDTLMISPRSALDNSTTYTVTVPAGAVTDEVMRYAAGVTFSFTTVSGSGGYVPGPAPGGEDKGDKTEETGEKPGQPDVPVEQPSEEEKQIEEIIERIDRKEIGSAKGDELVQIAKDVIDELNKAAQLTEAIDDPETAIDLSKALIEKTAAIAAKLEDEGKLAEADNFIEIINKLVEAALKKAGALEVEIVTGADGAKAQVIYDEEMLENLLSATEEMKKFFKDNNIEFRAEPVVYINASTGEEGVSDVDVSLDTDLLLLLKEKGIAGVEIVTDVGTMVIPSDAIELVKGKEIVIKTSKLDNSELSDTVKSAVGDSPVYDLAVTVDGKSVTLNKPVQVSLPYTPAAYMDTEKITVFYVNENGELENVIGVYDEATGTVVFDATHFSYYAVKYNDIKFSDVSDTFWAARYIEVLASKGIIKGIGDNKFAPSNNVTRAEFVALVVRAFKLVDEDAPNPFSDVQETDWFYPEVTSGAKYGIIQGRPGGIFAPNDRITREEMATIVYNVLVKVLGKKVPADAKNIAAAYTDADSIATYAKTPVNITSGYGIFSGRPDGTFAPKDNANRAEASKVIYMLFNMQ